MSRGKPFSWCVKRRDNSGQSTNNGQFRSNRTRKERSPVLQDPRENTWRCKNTPLLLLYYNSLLHQMILYFSVTCDHVLQTKFALRQFVPLVYLQKIFVFIPLGSFINAQVLPFCMSNISYFIYVIEKW